MARTHPIFKLGYRLDLGDMSTLLEAGHLSLLLVVVVPQV